LAAGELEFEDGGDGEENDHEVGEGVEAACEGKVDNLVDAFGLGLERYSPVVRGRSGCSVSSSFIGYGEPSRREMNLN
jgi:hypothetical protein